MGTSPSPLWDNQIDVDIAKQKKNTLALLVISGSLYITSHDSYSHFIIILTLTLKYGRRYFIS